MLSYNIAHESDIVIWMVDHDKFGLIWSTQGMMPRRAHERP
ncbi:hypothetical protein [Chlorobium phaeovibrioides]|nr:hypothetical protein [Chlorobium phaeovibrioides]